MIVIKYLNMLAAKVITFPSSPELCRYQGIFMTKAAKTRSIILHKAFDIIYTQGYRTTSVDDIIAQTKVTKGAFYYHFKTKDQMGLAIVHEVLKPALFQSFVQPLQDAENPLRAIYAMIRELLLENPFLEVAHGCPVGNLTQEMTPWNGQFREALADLMTGWDKALQQCVNEGKKKGIIRSNANARQVAYLLMSGYWGIRSLGKLYNSKECYKVYLKELRRYLKELEIRP